MVAPSVIGASTQCADSIRIAVGRGIARAHRFNSPTQPASSRSGGAPWARKRSEGNRPVDPCGRCEEWGLGPSWKRSRRRGREAMNFSAVRRSMIGQLKRLPRPAQPNRPPLKSRSLAVAGDCCNVWEPPFRTAPDTMKPGCPAERRGQIMRTCAHGRPAASRRGYAHEGSLIRTRGGSLSKGPTLAGLVGPRPLRGDRDRAICGFQRALPHLPAHSSPERSWFPVPHPGRFGRGMTHAFGDDRARRSPLHPVPSPQEEPLSNLSIGVKDVARPLAFPSKSAPAPQTLPRPVYPRAADQIVQFLVQNGVSTVFGAPRQPPVSHLRRPARLPQHPGHQLQARDDGGLRGRRLRPRHRIGGRGAGHRSGPGITNSLTGLASAFCDSLPVLMLAGEVPRSQFGRGALQEGSPYSLDVRAMVHSITKATFELTNSRSTGAVMGKALATARSGRKGPVFVSLPLDVTPRACRPGPDRGTGLFAIHRRSRVARRRGRFAGLGRASADPGGIGRALGAGDRSSCCAWRSAAPSRSRPPPRPSGVFPESHPLALGIYEYGGHPSTRRSTSKATSTIAFFDGGRHRVWRGGHQAPGTR